MANAPGAAEKEAALRRLEDVCREGAGSAAAGMSEMLGKKVTPVDLALVRSSIANLLEVFGREDEVTTSCAFTVKGDAKGDVFLVFPQETSRKLGIHLLNGLDIVDEQREQVRLDALAELGNVIGNAFLNAMASASGLALVPSPVSVAEDMAGAAADILQIRYGAVSNSVMILDVKFAWVDDPLRFQLCILFEAEGWEAILEGVEHGLEEGA